MVLANKKRNNFNTSNIQSTTVQAGARCRLERGTDCRFQGDSGKGAVAPFECKTNKIELRSCGSKTKNITPAKSSPWQHKYWDRGGEPTEAPLRFKQRPGKFFFKIFFNAPKTSISILLSLKSES